jgi:murein DD-endopeptidase MepM/ murein hydrolase activator NlpD
MQEYTVMIFRDHSSPVRRYKVAHQLLKRAALGAAGAALVMAVVLVDYVRVRSDVGELEALRTETGRQREQIRDFTHKMEQLDDQFARLAEFERKVRVIANLPGAVAETEVGSVPSGVGGGEDDESSLVREELVPAAAQGSRAARPRPAPLPGADWHSALDADATRLLHGAEFRERSFEELVEQLRGKSERLASTPSVWPARGWLTSGFGRRISPFTGKPHMHLGIDIAAERGTAVLAPARGRVAFVGVRGALGKTLEIDHGFGMTTIYGHCEAIHVRPGQRVERGQWVAAIGSSGRSTGPHLHYAIKAAGRAVDPRHYILD